MMRGSCTYVWVNSVRERDAVECFFSHRLMVQNVFTLCVYPPRDGIVSIILGHTIHRVSAKRQYHKESPLSRVVVAAPPRRRSTPRDVARRRETIERTRAMMTTSTLTQRFAFAPARPTRGSVGAHTARARRSTPITASIRATEKPQGKGARDVERGRGNDAREGVDRCARARNARGDSGDRARRACTNDWRFRG